MSIIFLGIIEINRIAVIDVRRSGLCICETGLGILSLKGGFAMVKGISRQVIVLHSGEQSLFEQAIFILNDKAVCGDGITDAQLLREAGRLMGNQKKRKKGCMRDIIWAGIGAITASLIFLIFGLL